MTQKKIILFIPSIEGGGVEKNFFIISNFLAKNLNNVFLITAEKNVSKRARNIKIIYPKSNFWRKSGRFRKYIICLFLLGKMILHEKNLLVFSFQANLYAIFLCKFFNTKVIARSNASPSGWSNNFFKKLIYKFGFNLADKIIVNSLQFKNEMKEKFSINPIHIYNPLNKKEILRSSKSRINEKFNKDSLKIITVGRLVDQKDHITLLKALNEIKNFLRFNLIIIGRGINQSKLEKYLKHNKINKLVKIYYTANPFPYIKASDLFILSSIYEGLPNVLLEAITLKKFVISSDCPTGPREILDNQKGGFLFKSGDFRTLGKKILEFSKRRKDLNKKIIYSYNNLGRFDYKKNLNKYLNVINSFN